MRWKKPFITYVNSLNQAQITPSLQHTTQPLNCNIEKKRREGLLGTNIFPSQIPLWGIHLLSYWDDCMIQPHHLLPKPILAITLLIYSYKIESKALRKSNLKRYHLPFLFFMKLIVLIAMKTLSKICLSLIKTLWWSLITFDITCFTMITSGFEIIL